MREAIWLGIALMLTAIAGCIGGPASEDAAPQTDATALDKESQALTKLQAAYGGFLYYRAATGVLPEAQYEGDPPGFCFTVPEDTTRIDARYTWEVPQPMMFKVEGPNGTGNNTFHRDQGIPISAFTHTVPPIVHNINEVEPGTWYVYAGPSGVGGATGWAVTLNVTVDRADATAEELIYDGEPCSY